MFKSYIHPSERTEADRSLPRLMVEGLLLGGAGLGVLALIFEIAADAFSVAAYQTLLAIYGAAGHHEIAILAFIVLSALLFIGIVPAYKAGAYLRPNAGGSGPLVEAIGPVRLRWLSWIGTSLFFLDAILTIIISSISAADVTMLIYPELTAYRILLAEFFAFFIMALLVALGPKRAVPLFLVGGGAFTIFTLFALTLVGTTASGNPEWAFLTEGIVSRLQATGIVEQVIRAEQEIPVIGSVIFFQLFFRSMSSAMLGFSGYEVIPASGKHAARPKWKVINTSLTLAAVFLIGTGIIQLLAARQWNIPATEGYSTLLIEYEIVAAQTLGHGVTPEGIVVTDADLISAKAIYEQQAEDRASEELLGGAPPASEQNGGSPDENIGKIAYDLAFSRSLSAATSGTGGESFLFIAGILLAFILLLAQGGGYVGGAAVAANAARLGRLPGMFADDRVGIVVIWAVSAILIPIIREVVVVEAYYAFGFVSAFVLTSTTVFFVRDDALRERGIEPGSPEARSLRFAGLRGMIASYIMAIVLVTQKTDALVAIVIAGATITLFQIYIANGNLKRKTGDPQLPHFSAGTRKLVYRTGIERAHDQARQRGLADALHDMITTGAIAKFNVDPERITRLISYERNVKPELLNFNTNHESDERIKEPSPSLEATYETAYNERAKLLNEIEYYSHYGIFTFINNYHLNWVDLDYGRDEVTVQQAMLDILFPLTAHDEIWAQYCAFQPRQLPESIWQFSRERYRWAKDQWPNLSDRLTTVWTLQELGLIPSEVDVKTVVAVAGGKQFKMVKVHTRHNSIDAEPADSETPSAE